MMMNTRKFVALLLLIFLSLKFNAQCKEVVGYYPNWQWYDRAQLVNPQSIDYSKYTILNYCFFNPEVDGSISLTDPWADENLLFGEIDWVNGGYIPNTSIVDVAHSNGVPVLPSIGGWTLSDNFPGIAADPVKRTAFANACVNLISTYNFDGIDLDWEYPGYAPHGGGPADMNNFTLLLQEIRSAIDTYGDSVGKTMMLTIAVGAGGDRMDDIDWSSVASTVDIINLMSYDFFGAWNATTNHNAPLYPPASGDPTINLDSAVERLTSFYAVDPQKITVGVAWYGRSAKTVGTPGLHVPTTGAADMVTFALDDGIPLYYNIWGEMSSFTQNWDSQAQVPYLTGNGSLNTFVSYDDEQSIGLKAQYIVDNNLRGAIIWEITGDYIETSPGSGIEAGTPLADTLNSVLCNVPPSVNISGATSICEGDSATLTASGASTYSWETGETTASITVSPTVTTSYTVTGTSSSGSDVDSITIIVNAAPSIPSITFSGGMLQSTAADYYQWYLGGVLISGATSQNYTPTASGDYQVEVTNIAGCSTISGIYTLTSVSLEDQLLVFNLYPTPAQEGFYIESEHLEGSKLELTDFTGRIIRSIEQIGSNKFYINTSDIAVGSYLIKITDSTNRIGIRQVIIR